MMIGQFATTASPTRGSPPTADNLALMLRDVAALEKMISETSERWDSALARSTMRIREQSERAETIRQEKLDPLLKALREASGKEFTKRGPEKRFRPTSGVGVSVADVFKSETRSNEINALRSACRPAPDFSRFRSSFNCDKKFSDPGFFYQEWQRTEIEKIDENERKLREEKEAKKRDKEKKKRELADGLGGSNRNVPQENGSEQKAGEASRPKRPPTSTIPTGASTAAPPVARRSSRPPTAGSSSILVSSDGAAPPARPVRADLAGATGEIPSRRASTALTSSAGAAATGLTPAPLARPPRPRTVAIPPSQPPQPAAAPVPAAVPARSANVSPTIPQPPPPPPRPVTEAAEAPVLRTNVPSPKKATPPPSPPQQEYVQESRVSSSDDASNPPVRPARRPRPPAPPMIGSVPPPFTSSQLESASVNQETHTFAKMPSESLMARPKRTQAPLSPAPASPAYTTQEIFREEAPPPPPPAKRAPLPPAAFNTFFSNADDQEEAVAEEPASQLVSNEDPALKKYIMMQKMNLPQGAIEQAMIRDKIDPSALFGSSVGAGVASVIEEQPQDVSNEDPVLKKYLTMQKMNLPQGAIEQAMIRDKVDPSRLFGANATSRLDAPAPKIVIPTRSEADRAAAAAPMPQSSGNSLMDELLKGRALKKVEAPLSPPRDVGGGAGSDLMAGILAGRGKLKKVEQPPPEAKKAVPTGALDGGGVASILARRIAIIGEKGSDTDSAGSEWDDSDDD